MTGWHAYARDLVERLAAAGELADPGWRAAFLAVPRHVFVPDRDLAEAYSDEALVTQSRATSAPAGSTIDLPTSSASAPGVMAVMLDRLDVRDDMRILEIGTGTGYNAALLAHRLGDDQVYSVDLDPELVASAGAALGEAGHHPTLAATDGYSGLPDAAPFDRIIATCAVTHLPPEWIRQLAPDGRIVAPLLGEGCALAVCDKVGPDEVAGHIDNYQVAFMPLRPRIDDPFAAGHRLGYSNTQIPYYGTTDLDPRTIGDANSDLRLFLHMHLSGLVVGSLEGPNGAALTLTTPKGNAEVYMVGADDGTWAVVQRGHRLWDTVEHAMRAWAVLGKPDRGRYGVTALDDIDRQYIWLDDVNGSHAWPMPL